MGPCSFMVSLSLLCNLNTGLCSAVVLAVDGLPAERSTPREGLRLEDVRNAQAVEGETA